MNDALRRLATLGAALAPGRAARLLGRLDAPGAEAAVALAAELSSAPRRTRLASLAAVLARPDRPGLTARPGHPLLARLLAEGLDAAALDAGWCTDGTADRAADRPHPDAVARAAASGVAREVNTGPGVTLPFALPSLSPGYAALDLAARDGGAAAAAAVARELGELLGLEVEIVARPRAGLARPGGAVASLPIELPALPGTALLEVEPSLVARLIDLVGGGTGRGPGATALTALERSALEFLVLAALDAVDRVPAIGDRLAPRLARAAPPPRAPLAVDLVIGAGPVRGRGRLLLPAEAVRALGGLPAVEGPAAALPIDGSLRGEVASLLPEELAALRPGDVLLVDPPPEGRHRLRFPGGFTAAGRLDGDTFTVEATAMDQPLAEIPLRLDVELARVPVSLADLARLAPGAVLPLAIDRRGLVTLRIGERTVARGELVELDGTVGVRVLAVELAVEVGGAP